MDNFQEYLTIMIESLEKKQDILSKIIRQNNFQYQAVTKEKFDEELFTKTIEEKEILVNRLNELDKGFGNIYDRIKEVLSENKTNYKDEINKMKKLITDITSLSIEVQISEKRNEAQVSKKFSEMRQEVHQTKAVNKVAASYYQNMNQTHVIEPQFLDKKK